MSYVHVTVHPDAREIGREIAPLYDALKIGDDSNEIVIFLSEPVRKALLRALEWPPVMGAPSTIGTDAQQADSL